MVKPGLAFWMFCILIYFVGLCHAQNNRHAWNNSHARECKSPTGKFGTKRTIGCFKFTCVKIKNQKFKWVQIKNLCCTFGVTPLKIGKSAETVAETGEKIIGVCKKKGRGLQLKLYVADEDTTTTAPTTTTTSTTTNATTTTTIAGSGPEENCGDYPEDHTMNVYPGPSEVCGDRRVFDGLTDEAKGLILDAHNELRQKVAAGLEGNGSQPGATNMRKLVWNTELETVAQRWASQCNFGHDSERSKCDGTYVGQNAYYSAKGVIQRTMKDPVVMQNAVNAVHAWYGEVESPGFDNSKIDPFVFSYGAGHYTQVVWADTTEIGCGLTYYQDGTWAHGVWYKTLVICNYAKGGNMQSGQMYEVGAGCTNCPSGTACDGTYSDLCA